MKIRNKLLWLLGASAILALALYFAIDISGKKVSKGVEVASLSWESPAKDGSIREPIRYKETDKARYKYFHIHFSFKANHNEGHPNILQTASSNSGIRLELGKPSVLALIVGRAEDSFVLTQALTLGAWHEVSIDISSNNHLRVTVDDILVVDQSRRLDYQIDDIAIGSGFSATRPFNGEIKVHTLSYGFMERNELLIKALASWILFAVVVFVAVLAAPTFRFLARIFSKAHAQWGVLKLKIPEFLRVQQEGASKIPRFETNRKSEKAELVKLILVVGTVAAIIFHYSRFAFVGDHAPKPDSFLHFPVNIFCDFYSLFDGYVRMRYSVAMNYLPALFIPLDLLARVTVNNPYLAIKILLALYLALLVPYIYLSLRGMRAVPRTLTSFALIACNYPVLFTIHSGNFEMLCFLLVAYAILFRIKKLYVLAGTLIGIAAAIKLYPAIFLFSIVSRKNWKQLFLGSAVGFALSITIGFAMTGSMLGNIVAWAGVVQRGFENYTGMMVLSYNGVYFGHSIMNAFRIIVGPGYSIAALLPYYSIFSAIAILGVLAVMQKSRYLYLRVLLPACAICLFAPTSQDYKLLYLTIPLLMLLRSNRNYRHETALCVLVTLIFIPKAYITFYGSTYVNTNTLLNASLLLIVLSYGMYLSFFDKKFKRSDVPGSQTPNEVVLMRGKNSS